MLQSIFDALSSISLNYIQIRIPDEVQFR